LEDKKVNIDNLEQYFNGITGKLGNISDNLAIKLDDINRDLNNLNNTLTITNILIMILIVVSIVNLIFKWKKR
jgi:hypothetical protein